VATVGAVRFVAVALVVLLVSGCGGTTEETAAPTDDTPTMAEKPFLDRYEGQSLDELLALTDTYRVDSVLLAIESALLQKPPAELSEQERVVLAVEALEREVNNGGYNQFFLNEPSYADEIVQALNKIGCPETARITREAVAVLGIRSEWPDDQVQAAAADATEEQDAKLYALDGEFFEYPDPIEDRLLAFIRANVAAIRL
jgi:hypothetical protein